MPFALLLAMQASGMIVDYFASSNQQKMMEMGSKIQQAGIESNIQQTRLEAEDESLQSLKKLRQTLGTQIATFAARGTSTAAGSAVGLMQGSVGNFNTDERMRRMNLLAKTNSLKGEGLISQLNNAGESSKLWQGFASRTINRFPGTTAGWKQGIADAKSSFGLTSSGS